MVIDTVMHNTLLAAGLVDGSGNFTSQPNFGGPREDGMPDDHQSARPARSAPDDGGDDDPFGEPKPEAKPEEKPQEQPQQEPASQPQVQPSPSAPNPGASGLDSSNPNQLGGESDPVRQSYDQQVQQLQQTAMLAFANGRAAVNEQGERLYSDEELAARIGQEYQYYAQQAYLGAVMQKMQPVAKRAAAEGIAKEYGVDLDDIINEENPVAMTARAKTIADLTRDGRFVKRRNDGVDTAEGSRSYSNSIPEAIENLSPRQKMYIGFARGDY